MKKALLPLLLILFIACKNEKKKEVAGKDPVMTENKRSVIGKWVVIDGKFDEEITEEERKNIIGKNTLEFYPGGKLTGRSASDTIYATYSLTEKADMIILNFDEEGDPDETDSLSIDWKDDIITISDKEGSMTLKRIKNN